MLKSGGSLWIAALCCLAISLTPWGPLVLYPFTLFTTWVHECSHAVMVVVMGGRVASITIQPDTSGLTRSLMPPGLIGQGLVASAGYLGASLVGCLLMAAARVDRRTRQILWGIGAFMLVTLIFWIRHPFGAVVVLGWAVTLLALARNGGGGASRFFLSVLAIQVALNAVYDIRILFLVNGPSDARTMARLFVAPAWVWAAVWMALSVAMLAWTLRATRLGLPRGRR
jgi:Peptidase M50B-like